MTGFGLVIGSLLPDTMPVWAVVLIALVMAGLVGAAFGLWSVGRPEPQRVRDAIAVSAAAALLDALADLSEYACERGQRDRIVLDPRGDGEWIVFLGPVHVDFPYSFATGDLPTALEHLRDVVREHG